MTETAKTKWLALIYGSYAYTGRSDTPKVLEIDAATLDEVWDRLRFGAMTGGDNLDDIRLDCIQPSLGGLQNEDAETRACGPREDTAIRVFRADEVPFLFLNDYLNKRVASEMAQRSAAADAAQVLVMQAIAERLGYRCEKT